MPHKRRNKGELVLRKIRRQASAYVKKHPGASYQAQLRKFGKEHRQHVAGVHKKRKTRSRTRIRHKARRHRVGAVNKSHTDRIDRKKVDITIGSISQHKAAIRKQLQDRLGLLLTRKEMAITKTKKRFYTKRIAHVKKELRALEGK
jgi:hypothetical protein